MDSGKSIGEGKHEGYQSEADNQSSDAVIVGVGNAGAFDGVFAVVIRNLHRLSFLIFALIQGLRHPQRNLRKEDGQEHTGNLQEDERNHADENLLQSHVLFL